jgi:hypothetical protein
MIDGFPQINKTYNNTNHYYLYNVIYKSDNCKEEWCFQWR